MADEKLHSWVEAIAGEGVSTEGSQKAYADWANTFEEVNLQTGYSGPVKVGETTAKVISKELRENVHILDIGAGTGLVAKELKKAGFLHIDAFEPSESMLSEAKKLNLYENYIVDFFSEDVSGLRADSYDVVTGSGIFAAKAHVSCEALNEMVRLVKPGGYVVLAARHYLIYDNEKYKYLEPLMKDLASNAKWKPVIREVFQGYHTEMEGIVWCFQVL